MEIIRLTTLFWLSSTKHNQKNSFIYYYSSCIETTKYTTTEMFGVSTRTNLDVFSSVHAYLCLFVFRYSNNYSVSYRFVSTHFRVYTGPCMIEGNTCWCQCILSIDIPDCRNKFIICINNVRDINTFLTIAHIVNCNNKNYIFFCYYGILNVQLKYTVCTT